MTPEEIAARGDRPMTVSRHAAQVAALSAEYGTIGDHDIMEAQAIDPIVVAPKTTGRQRALTREAEKRTANAEIPHIERPETRQQKRAKVRAATKAMSKHMNEHVGGKNRKRRG